MSTMSLTNAEAFRIVREMKRDRSFEQTALGPDVMGYLRAKRKRLTDSSFEDYEATLAEFCWHFGELELADLEPPAGAARVEAFLDHRWGSSAPRTYNKNLSILRDFFKWCVRRGLMNGDPTLVIDRAKTRDVHREVFPDDTVHMILAENPDRRDRICLRLLLIYGVRRGTLKAVRFQHFDHQRRRLTVTEKGGKVRTIPLPDPALWMDLERLILDTEAAPDHYLLPKRIGNQHARRFRHGQPRGHTAVWEWWYECLERAGVVPKGVRTGAKMHQARYTAGQRLLDATGNLKAVQTLLGHANVQTTAEHYVSWDEEHLAASLRSVIEEEDE